MEKPSAVHLQRHLLSESYAARESKSFIKWESMRERGLEWFVTVHPQTYRRRLRRGTLQQFRWEAWKTMLRWYLTQARLPRETSPTTGTATPQVTSDKAAAFTSSPSSDVPKLQRLDILSSVTEAEYSALAETESPFSALIRIDIPRTFPEVNCFTTSAQEQLSRILNAYANYKPVVGYCQGMNFVVGFILLVSDFCEFEAFQFVVGFMDCYAVEGLFREHFPLLKKYVEVFDNLMERLVPSLRDHFFQEGILPPVYLHQWFLTLFVRGLPLSTVVVIWDYLLADGLPSMVVLTVSLLKVLQRFLLCLGFEDVVKFLKSLKSSGDCDQSRIGRMLVRQAEAIQVPEELLTPIRNVNVEDLAKQCALENSALGKESSRGRSGTLDALEDDQEEVSSDNRHSLVNYWSQVIHTDDDDDADDLLHVDFGIRAPVLNENKDRKRNQQKLLPVHSCPPSETYPCATTVRSPCTTSTSHERIVGRPRRHHYLDPQLGSSTLTRPAEGLSNNGGWIPLYASPFWRFPYYRAPPSSSSAHPKQEACVTRNAKPTEETASSPVRHNQNLVLAKVACADGCSPSEDFQSS